MMDSAEYAESIRLDKPKTKTEEEVMLRKRLIMLSYKNVPLFGAYMLFNFFIMTQWLTITRAEPAILWADILAMCALLIHTWLYGRLLQRYLTLEAKNFYNEIKKLEGKNERI